MKNLKVITGILAIAFVTLTAVACKNETKKTDSGTDMQNMEMNHQMDATMNHSTGDENRNIEVSTQKNPATTPIIDAYIQIKNGLVADNKESAANGATALLVVFTAFDMSQLTGETHKEYMEILESAKEHAEHIVKSPLEHQREHFETLSTDVNDLITLLGTDKTLYQDYCPMVKASWLSESKEIKNPFYGSKMLTCGTVKKQIN